MVNNGPFMEFIGFTKSESAANTYTEEEIQTPVGKTENLAMLIHKILYKHPVLDDPALHDQSNIQVVKKSQSAILNLGDSDVIDQSQRHFNALTEGGGQEELTVEHTFDPPVLYAKSKIVLGFNSVGQAGAEIYSAKIGYTLEKVSKNAFIDALTE